MTTATRPSNSTPGTNTLRIALLVAIAVAVLAVAAFLVGRASVPTADDARAAESVAYDDAHLGARTAAEQPAYDAAFTDAYDAGSEQGSTDGTAAGTAAAK